MDEVLPKDEPMEEQQQPPQSEMENFDNNDLITTPTTEQKNISEPSIGDEPMPEQSSHQPLQTQPDQQQPQQSTQPEQSQQPEQPQQPEQVQPPQQPEQSQQQQPSTHSEAPQQLFGFTTNARTSAPTLTKSNLLEAIVDFDSSLPDAVVHHFLNIAGMQTSDQRIIRLIAIAAQKFIHDIVSDSLQHCKLRGKKTKDKKYTLAIEDLASALAEYGIEVRRQHYFN